MARIKSRDWANGKRPESRATNGHIIDMSPMPGSVDKYVDAATIARADQVAFLATLDPIAYGACPVYCGHVARDKAGRILLDDAGNAAWVLDAAIHDRVSRDYIDNAKRTGAPPAGMTHHPYPYHLLVRDVVAYILAIRSGNIPIALLCARQMIGSGAAWSDSLVLGGMGMRKAPEHAIWRAIVAALESADKLDRLTGARKPDLVKIDGARKALAESCDALRAAWVAQHPDSALPASADLVLALAAPATLAGIHAAHSAPAPATTAPAPASDPTTAPAAPAYDMSGAPVLADDADLAGAGAYLAALKVWRGAASSASERQARRAHTKIAFKRAESIVKTGASAAPAKESGA